MRVKGEGKVTLMAAAASAAVNPCRIAISATAASTAKSEPDSFATAAVALLARAGATWLGAGRWVVRAGRIVSGDVGGDTVGATTAQPAAGGESIVVAARAATCCGSRGRGRCSALAAGATTAAHGEHSVLGKGRDGGGDVAEGVGLRHCRGDVNRFLLKVPWTPPPLKAPVKAPAARGDESLSLSSRRGWPAEDGLGDPVCPSRARCDGESVGGGAKAGAGAGVGARCGRGGSSDDPPRDMTGSCCAGDGNEDAGGGIWSRGRGSDGGDGGGDAGGGEGGGVGGGDDDGGSGCGVDGRGGKKRTATCEESSRSAACTARPFTLTGVLGSRG